MAAETDPEYSANLSILYARELEFVAAYTNGSIDAADDVLRDGLRERSIDWKYWELDYGDGCDFDHPKFERVCKRLLQAGISGEGIEGYLGRAEWLFWQESEHTRITVHRATSSATRTGPPWAIKSRFRLDIVDGKSGLVEDCVPVYFLDFPPVTLTAKLIRLRHEHVVRRLRFIGLLSQEEVSLALQQFATQPKPGPESKPKPPREAVSRSAVEWLTAEASRMKKAREIPDSKKSFADELARRMNVAAESDRSLMPFSAGHIRNQLEPWGLWPPSAIN